MEAITMRKGVAGAVHYASPTLALAPAALDEPRRAASISHVRLSPDGVRFRGQSIEPKCSVLGISLTRTWGIHKGLRGYRPRWPCAMPGPAPIPPAGQRGSHRSAFPSRSDAANRSPKPPVAARL